MARLRYILGKGERIVLRLPTARQRMQRMALWGIGTVALAMLAPYPFGFRHANGGVFLIAVALCAAAGLFLMTVQYWKTRPHTVVTGQRILVRRGWSWWRYEELAVRAFEGMNYDLESRTLYLYGGRRVLAIPCDRDGYARIVATFADLIYSTSRCPHAVPSA